jgi:hypothetical protein
VATAKRIKNELLEIKLNPLQKEESKQSDYLHQIEQQIS